jgi:deoxyribonuclease V
MKARVLHSWRLSASQAVLVQERLRSEIRLLPMGKVPRLVAGADVAYSPLTRRLYAGVAVVALPSLELVETAEAERAETFPYIPGLFAFRELPVLIDAFERLEHEPDAVLFDGHGIAHPRRFGIASHASLLLEVPAIGCAKCLLVAPNPPLAAERCSMAPLVADGETVGLAVRTRAGTGPVFVSPGGLIDTEGAARVVLACTGRYRTPEPLRRSHMVAVALRRRRDPLRPPATDEGYTDLLNE